MYRSAFQLENDVFLSLLLSCLGRQTSHSKIAAVSYLDIHREYICTVQAFIRANNTVIDDSL